MNLLEQYKALQSKCHNPLIDCTGCDKCSEDANIKKGIVLACQSILEAGCTSYQYDQLRAVVELAKQEGRIK